MITTLIAVLSITPQLDDADISYILYNNTLTVITTEDNREQAIELTKNCDCKVVIK